jgi:hypothetical protein
MRQRPGSFFFCPIGQMVQVTFLVAAAPHDQSQANQSSERHERALGMVGHPQPLSTADTFLGAGSVIFRKYLALYHKYLAGQM